MLEYAKYFEITGQVERALDIMDKIRHRFKNEWKVQFEVVMMQVRLGFFEEAEEMVEESLQVHSSTGRLWAVYI